MGEVLNRYEWKFMIIRYGIEGETKKPKRQRKFSEDIEFFGTQVTNKEIYTKQGSFKVRLLYIWINLNIELFCLI